MHEVEKVFCNQVNQKLDITSRQCYNRFNVTIDAILLYIQCYYRYNITIDTMLL